MTAKSGNRISEKVMLKRKTDVRCSRCNAPMACEPQGDCWCKALPPLPAPDYAAGCYCESCLRSALEASGRAQRSAERGKSP